MKEVKGGKSTSQLNSSINKQHQLKQLWGCLHARRVLSIQDQLSGSIYVAVDSLALLGSCKDFDK